MFYFSKGYFLVNLILKKKTHEQVESISVKQLFSFINIMKFFHLFKTRNESFLLPDICRYS